MFATRDPARQAWRAWDREHSYQRVQIPEAGAVQAWVEVTDVSGELVSFRWTFLFEQDDAVLTSDSTLRFRHRPQVTRSLLAEGFHVDEVRDAPDRPGRELVFIARRGD